MADFVAKLIDSWARAQIDAYWIESSGTATVAPSRVETAGEVAGTGWGS